MTIARTHRLVKKFAAAVALAGALAVAPAALAPQSAHADAPGHSTRDDSHPGKGTYNDTHAIPSDLSNRSEPVHAIPAQRSETYDSDGGYHDICAYKPYFYACR
ncbi:hypothetical protein [Nocardia sp. NPDC019395]|uniref:hypothetical protein n=1 Tax=Nocardia sp. NPDC019395 TaxID=3154686 RepID=UPI003407A929